MRTKLLQTFVLSVAFGIGCSGTDANPLLPGFDVGGATGAIPTGGAGPTATGGATSVATTTAVVAPTGGKTSTGGTTSNPSTGGSPTGGKAATGGAATGGAPTGGKPATGGTTSVAATGGASTGGKSSMGGAATGGKSSMGGAATGGATAAGGSASCTMTQLTGGSQVCSSNQTGNTAGYGWSIWSSGSGGCITPYGSGAAFKASWNNSGDFLARMGCSWNETQTYDKYGDITADYSYTKSGSAGGYSYLGIYGWSNNPLIEFYIVDDWYGNGPPTGGGTQVGSFTQDGGTYKIYKHQQVNQPSIHGNATFWQYFSVRQTARQCGHIDLSAHFKEWASLSLNLGNMSEAKLVVEAGGGSGSIDFHQGAMTCK